MSNKKDNKKNDLHSKYLEQQDVINAQRKEIDELKETVKSLSVNVVQLQKDMDVLNSDLKISTNVSNVLRAEVDNLQQYSRRYSIVLDGVAPKQNESIAVVEKDVKTILTNKFSVNPAKLDQEFDKAHRIGVVRDGKQSIIVRFKSHSFRAQLYAERKKYQGKPNNNCKLRISLTAHRRKLLNTAKDKIQGHEKIAFAYANINGDIKIRLANTCELEKKVVNVKSIDDVDNILRKLYPENHENEGDE